LKAWKKYITMMREKRRRRIEADGHFRYETQIFVWFSLQQASAEQVSFLQLRFKREKWALERWRTLTILRMNENGFLGQEDSCPLASGLQVTETLENRILGQIYDIFVIYHPNMMITYSLWLKVRMCSGHSHVTGEAFWLVRSCKGALSRWHTRARSVAYTRHHHIWMPCATPSEISLKRAFQKWIKRVRMRVDSRGALQMAVILRGKVGMILDSIRVLNHGRRPTGV